MPQKKKSASKSSSKSKIKEKQSVANPEIESETTEEEEIVGPKAKKSVDIESALEPATIIDEKSDDDLPVVTEDGEDSLGDELSLDDEELNPFGDKWEQ
jgi:hypothetical protein